MENSSNETAPASANLSGSRFDFLDRSDVVVTDVRIWPEGATPGCPNARWFALDVVWRGARTDTGRGGYAVVSMGDHLSKSGAWRYEPEPVIQRHYRWDTLKQAVVAARAALPTVMVNGVTWAQLQERIAADEAAEGVGGVGVE